ncbi:hypothetical protein BH24ACT3_BH24ACT3_05540 [soil metagenome]
MAPSSSEGPLQDVERLLARGDAGYKPAPSFDRWLVETIELGAWDRAAGELQRARDASSQDAVQAGLKSSLRAAAIDTGALEGLYTTDRGFNWSVAQGLALSQIEVEKGEEVRRLFESQLAGFELALDVATGQPETSEALIRRLHEVSCAGQATYRVLTPLGVQTQRLPLGSYKSSPNHVVLEDGSVHSYAPTADVPAEMHRLVTDLRSELFARAHPVVQAAYAHHALTWIHPFADGNGRVARLVASIFLLRASSTPLVVFADERARYLIALAAADRGRTGEFVQWLQARSVALLRDLTESLVDDSYREDLKRGLGSLRETKTGFDRRRLAELCRTLIERLREHLQDLLDEAGAGPDGQVELLDTLLAGQFPEQPGWSFLMIDQHFIRGLRISITAPPRLHEGHVLAQINDAADPVDTFRPIEPTTGSELVVSLSEIDPAPTAALDQRLERFARRILATELKAVE